LKPQTERLLLLILTAIQFCVTLDFVIILPLGPQFVDVMHITLAQSSLIVSSYAIAAGITGIAAGFFIDLVDRKTALLWFFFGFAIGTLLCALAPTYPLLVAARAVAGASGGVTGALVLSIVGDVVPEGRRGKAMGMVWSSFSMATIAGVPLGLWLASTYTWHVPFYAIGGICVPIFLLIFLYVPHLREHLHHAKDHHPAARMWAVMIEVNHQMAFVFMAVLTCASFIVVTEMPHYLERNVGVTKMQLPLVYFLGGLCTVFSMNWIGRWSDRAGKRRVFTIMSISAVFPILLLTNLPRVPLWATLTTCTLMMIGMTGRFVPAMALMTGVVESRFRGGFMSVNSSMQQFSGGIAAWLSGLIVEQSESGEIRHYPIAGLVSVTCVLTCIWLVRFLKPAAGRPAKEEPIFVEAI
jgi:predicted MFS family arabinose efflux permease